MLRSVKFRLGKIGLTLGLAGGMALFLFHRAHSPSALPAAATETNPVSTPMGIRANPPETASTAVEFFPVLNGSESDEELLALARPLVARSPERALEWARSQSDGLRERLRSAVVRAWGEKDPAGAVDWALVQDDDERRVDMEAALAGAVRQPQLALAIVRRLLADDPEDSAGCGPALVVALSNAGQFQTALKFLNVGPPDSHADWATATFHRWGESRPEDAVRALQNIADENLRAIAFQAVADGWSAGNPAGLAAYALTLPRGENRDYALGRAMDNWSMQDPAGLATWVNTLPPGKEADAGAALMIAKTDGANRTPELAMQWVENIDDPALKLDSLAHVLTQWNRTDPAATRQYVATATWLSDPQREEILKTLASIH